MTMRKSPNRPARLSAVLAFLATTSRASVAMAAGGGSSATTTGGGVLSGGLVNLGNTCYLNAQLECAFHVPRVRELIVSPESGRCSANPALDPSGGEEEATIALLSLRQVFSSMAKGAEVELAGFGRPASTSVLCRNLGINVYEQQDSQEFWKLLLPELNSPGLMDLYQGAYESYISALDGSGRERSREEAFLDLSLEVSSGSVAASMEDMFTKPEVLSEKEGNGWRPEKGADKVDALKGTLLRVQGLPSLLQLHLMRFKYDWQTDTMSKINDRFTFPKTLDVSEICTDIKQNEKSAAIYDLQSVVVHIGQYGSGHYYSYVRPDINKNRWYRFDDDKVTEVSFDDVMKDAYGGEDGTQKKGLLARLFGGGGGSGWGGRTSSAYMLQYARRCDAERLFGVRKKRSK